MAAPSVALTEPDAAGPRQYSRVSEVWHTLRQNMLVLIGTVLVTIFFLVGAVGLVLVATPSLQGLYADQDLMHALAPPFSAGHILGTDNLGRDVAYRLTAGLGLSLLVGVAVTALSLFFGMIFGVLAGYFRSWPDVLIGAVVDVTLGFPVILFAVVVAGALGPGLLAVVVSVGLINWAGFARIIRGQTLSLREREFVEAAEALGVPTWKILLNHFVPNLLPPTLVMASYYMAVAIIVEAGLSFIGLGTQPPTPSLGQMISDGRNFLYVGPWPAVFSCGVLALVVLGLSTLGDGLRDIFDPRLGRQ